jgi:hypothetical protein
VTFAKMPRTSTTCCGPLSSCLRSDGD